MSLPVTGNHGPGLIGFQTIEPPAPRTCHGNQSCTIAWLDDGEAPLLDIIDICYVALYNGERVSQLDVSRDRPLTRVAEVDSTDNPGRRIHHALAHVYCPSVFHSTPLIHESDSRPIQPSPNAGSNSDT